MWTVWRSLALAERGIRINCTLPGPTDTPMMPDFEEQMGKAFMDNYPIPLGHRQTPDEQAAPLVFLNSPAASAITGEAILTDGGTMAAAGRGYARRVGLRVLSRMTGSGGATVFPSDHGDEGRVTPSPSPRTARAASWPASIGDPSIRDVVYGGQLLAQMILASDQVATDKDVASIHTLFPRAAG